MKFLARTWSGISARKCLPCGKPAAFTAALTATVALHDDRGRQLWGLAPGTSYQTLACRALLAPWVGCSQLASAILLRSQQLLACLCGQHHCLVHVLLQAICCEHCFVISRTAVAFLSRAATLYGSAERAGRACERLGLWQATARCMGSALTR